MTGVGRETQAGGRAKRHRHEFTALYDHFGPYGDPDAHRHVCFVDGCDTVLVGKGRVCVKGQKHRRVRP